MAAPLEGPAEADRLWRCSASGEGAGAVENDNISVMPYGDLTLVFKARGEGRIDCLVQADFCVGSHGTRSEGTIRGVQNVSAGFQTNGGTEYATCGDEGQEPPEPVWVETDVKPGDEGNVVNTRSKGAIPVAILTTEYFDAASVDGSTVCFGDSEGPEERDCTELKGTGVTSDVDGDGDEDLLLHFDTEESGIDSGDYEACLTGVTTDGGWIDGCDWIRTVGY